MTGKKAWWEQVNHKNSIRNILNFVLTSITILPTGAPSAVMSKNTLGKPIFLLKFRINAAVVPAIEQFTDWKLTPLPANAL